MVSIQCFKYQFPVWLHTLYRGVTWRRNPQEKSLYLTFDDGCVPEVTPAVLDILRQYGIQATFFCVGDNVSKYPGLYEQLLRSGHKTGNHTFHHLRGTATRTEHYLHDVAEASRLIDSRLFRPPYGRITWWQKYCLRKRYEIVMWDVLTNDFDSSQSPENILAAIKRYTRNGSIIVFHDSIKAAPNMLVVLPQALKWWLDQGYTFKLL